MTRIPARAIPRNPKPRPAALNGSKPAEGTPAEPQEHGFYTEAFNSLFRGELDVLSADVLIFAVEIGPDAYTPNMDTDRTLADVPATAIRGNSPPLEGKTVAGGGLHAAPTRVRDIAEGETVNGTIVVADTLGNPGMLVALETFPPFVGDGESYPAAWDDGEYVLRLLR
jgi:hypothetical protein